MMLALTGGIYLWNLVDIYLLPPGCRGKIHVSTEGDGITLAASFPLGF
jgi:hypothetical protein